MPDREASKVVIHDDTVYPAGLTAAKTVGHSLAEQSAEILSLIDGFLAKAGTDKSKLGLTATIWLARHPHRRRVQQGVGRLGDPRPDAGARLHRGIAAGTRDKKIEIQVTAAK